MLAGIVASIVCGIIGVIIVEKKLVMMSGGIAHTSYAGVGLGYFLGFEPIIGAFIFSVLAATGIYYLKKKAQARPDVSIGLFWSLGMALGIIFIALTPGYPPDLNSYLFGNILSVTRTDLYMTGGLAAFVVLAVSLFYNHWKAYLFDDEFAGVLGIKTSFGVPSLHSHSDDGCCPYKSCRHHTCPCAPSAPPQYPACFVKAVSHDLFDNFRHNILHRRSVVFLRRQYIIRRFDSDNIRFMLRRRVRCA